MIVWLASYPRSGNSYVRAILNHYFELKSYSMHGDFQDIGSNIALGKLVGHEAGHKTNLNIHTFRLSKKTYFIKTHEVPTDMISNEDTVFYILRDGRDASASYLKYLHSVVGRTATTLEDVLVGTVTFGSWGNHVLQWHQAAFHNTHIFKFEHITVDADAFAERLSGILKRERSREPFPDIETFRNVAPSFVGTGRSGGHRDVFSEMHSALFELCSGPAMHLAGYEPGNLSDDQLAAYRAFCERSANVAELAQTVEGLNSALGRVTAERDRFNVERDMLKTEIALAKEKHNRLMRYTAVGALRWIAARARDRKR